MGGGHHTGAHFPAELDKGNGQGRALGRVGTGAQLVIEHQGSAVALGHHIHNGAHMAGEGGKALCDGLLVTDVGKNGVKGGKGAAVSCRHMEAALCHQGQQADGFQGYGFTAGIGAGDDHGIKVRPQPKRNGDHLFGVDQRMPGLAQLDPALVIHNGSPGVHPVGELCLGEDHVQLNEHGGVQPDGFGIACCLGR